MSCVAPVLNELMKVLVMDLVINYYLKSVVIIPILAKHFNNVLLTARKVLFRL